MHIKWLAIFVSVQIGYGITQEAEPSKKVWRDPNDPTREHRTRQVKSLPVDVATIQKFQPDQSLRLILRQLLQELRIDYQVEGAVQRDVQVKISRYSMSVLSKYLKSDDADSAQDRESVRSALSNIFKVLEPTPDPTWHDTFIYLQRYLFPLNLFILPAATIVVIRSITRPRNFWIIVFSTILLVSMYSGYNRKYQEAESRRFAQFQQSSTDACAPEGLLSRMVEIVASPFQYRQKSSCLKYIESQTISIFHEISIIEVFSETISSGFFAFLSASAKHLNHFFRDLYDGAPIIAQIVMTVFLVLMVGTIRTPFFSYEPIWLTFCSRSIGQITGWLEGNDQPEPLPAIQANQTKKEVKQLKASTSHQGEEARKVKSIEYCPKSEREENENGKGEEEKKENILETRQTEMKVKKEEEEEDLGDDLSILGELSEDEEKDSETEWNEAINCSSISETSF